MIHVYIHTYILKYIYKQTPKQVKKAKKKYITDVGIPTTSSLEVSYLPTWALPLVLFMPM